MWYGRALEHGGSMKWVLWHHHHRSHPLALALTLYHFLLPVHPTKRMVMMRAFGPTKLTIGLFWNDSFPTKEYTLARVKALIETHWLQGLKAEELGIQFVWEADPKRAAVRIYFHDESSDTYSAVGRECLLKPSEEVTNSTLTVTFASLLLRCSCVYCVLIVLQATTVIGVAGKKEQEIDAEILHEFGHVLGFEHEHQHPLRPFKWNEAVVKADPRFKHQNNWDEKKVREQILDPVEKQLSKIAEFYDPESIMNYSYPGSWIIANSDGKGMCLAFCRGTAVTSIDL